MRILLRNEDTGLYYVHASEWTENPFLAHDFHSGGLATPISAKLNLQKASLLFQFNDPALNFSIPLPAPQTRSMSLKR